MSSPSLRRWMARSDSLRFSPRSLLYSLSSSRYDLGVVYTCLRSTEAKRFAALLTTSKE